MVHLLKMVAGTAADIAGITGTIQSISESLKEAKENAQLTFSDPYFFLQNIDLDRNESKLDRCEDKTKKFKITTLMIQLGLGRRTRLKSFLLNIQKRIFPKSSNFVKVIFWQKFLINNFGAKREKLRQKFSFQKFEKFLGHFGLLKMMKSLAEKNSNE